MKIILENKNKIRAILSIKWNASWWRVETKETTRIRIIKAGECNNGVAMQLQMWIKQRNRRDVKLRWCSRVRSSIHPTNNLMINDYFLETFMHWGNNLSIALLIKDTCPNEEQSSLPISILFGVYVVSTSKWWTWMVVAVKDPVYSFCLRITRLQFHRLARVFAKWWSNMPRRPYLNSSFIKIFGV